MIDIMNNEAELACIVAHEVAHAIARHGGERISGEFLQKLGFFSSNHPKAPNDHHNTDKLQQLNRSYEYEADLIGLILMAKAGYDPRVAINFWSRFNKEKKTTLSGTAATPHPCNTDRIRNFQNHMPLAEKFYKEASDKKGIGIIFRR